MCFNSSRCIICIVTNAFIHGAFFLIHIQHIYVRRFYPHILSLYLVFYLPFIARLCLALCGLDDRSLLAVDFLCGSHLSRLVVAPGRVCLTEVCRRYLLLLVPNLSNIGNFTSCLSLEIANRICRVWCGIDSG